MRRDNYWTPEHLKTEKLSLRVLCGFFFSSFSFFVFFVPFVVNIPLFSPLPSCPLCPSWFSLFLSFPASLVSFLKNNYTIREGLSPRDRPQGVSINAGPKGRQSIRRDGVFSTDAIPKGERSLK
jgi:hypothetical protein